MSSFSKLREVADVVDSLHKTPKYSDVGRPMVRCTDVRYGRLKLDDTYRVNEGVFEEFSRRYKPQRNDIIITRVGSYGITALVDDPNFCLGQNTSAIIPKINPRYLYAMLNSSQIKNQIEFAVVGSTQKTLSLKAINNLDIPRFDEPIEDRIAEIIGGLDDKIELNRQINQTLEHIAQAIFKSWFVDFDPVKAKIQAKQNGRARQDGERNGSQRKTPNVSSDATWPGAQARAGAEGDPERAAMCAISGKTDADLDAFLEASTPEQRQQLTATAALFPDEFKDSDLGPIPRDWKAGKLGDLYSAKGGFAYKSKDFITEGKPVVKIKNITGSGTVDLLDVQYIDDNMAAKSNRFILGDGDLIMAMTGATVGKTGIIVTNTDSVPYLNQRVAKFESKYEMSEPSWYVFCFFRLKSKFEELVGNASGSAQPNISASGIESTSLIAAPSDLVTHFNEVVDSLFRVWIVNNKENLSLGSIRASLLPRLLSGEITLDRAQSKTEAVA